MVAKDGIQKQNSHGQPTKVSDSAETLDSEQAKFEAMLEAERRKAAGSG